MSGANFPSSLVIECGHCGNITPHERIFDYVHPMVFEQFDDELLNADFTWLCYRCGTCGGLNVFGDFLMDSTSDISRTRLHPKASSILPPAHLLSPGQPIPTKVYNVYREIWPLRHRSPAAFVAQIRRLLEYICDDKSASGKDLFEKLNDLVEKGVVLGCFSEMTDLLRRVGNLGSHATDMELDIWDAELVDDVFRSVVDAVYVAPARLERMKERMRMHIS